jgi:hypothetical protein
MYTAVYGAGDCSVVRTALAQTTASSFGPCRHLGPAVSQPFSAILGDFGRGTAILRVFGGGMAQKRLDPNVCLCGQVILSFGPQPLAPLHHRLAVSQPLPSPKCKFWGVKMENSASYFLVDLVAHVLKFYVDCMRKCCGAMKIEASEIGF